MVIVKIIKILNQFLKEHDAFNCEIKKIEEEQSEFHKNFEHNLKESEQRIQEGKKLIKNKWQ